jgi:hypothetical protein
LCDDYSVLQMAVNILGGKKRMDVISLWQFLWHGAREAPVSDAYYIYHYKYTYSGSMKLKWISKLSILWWSDHV